MNRRTFLRSALWFPIASSAAASLSAGLVDENKAKDPRRGPFPAGVNPAITGVHCLRCKKVFPLASGVMDTGEGCPVCLAQGYPANLTFAYAGVSKTAFSGSGAGITRFRNLLPLLDFPTLGEGNTPLLSLGSLAKKLGLAELYAKDESRGPTGSHKDRTSGLIVARAAQLKRPGVIAASSGNGGHSLAAYAGSAGVACVILSKKNLSGPWKLAIDATGARLIITETADDRWKVMKEMVEKEGWYPFTNFLSPPVGSNSIAVQGCKTIAYEIAEQLAGNAPDAVIVPTCRGDLLWGLYEGFAEARRAGIISREPRLYAVEPYPRLERILAGVDYRTVFIQPDHPMVSIGGTTSSYQAELAVKLSGGGACSVTTPQTLAARQELAARGLYLELSSAAGLAGLYGLVKRGTVRGGERVVLVCTSHGYKQLQ
jgi:threonine synthase